MRWNDKIEKLALAMRSEGKTYREIERVTSMSRVTVRRRLERVGKSHVSYVWKAEETAQVICYMAIPYSIKEISEAMNMPYDRITNKVAHIRSKIARIEANAIKQKPIPNYETDMTIYGEQRV
jgi:hypothetical protein